jgi:RNA polymerase sigma-70 factor (ECF subfamily)
MERQTQKTVTMSDGQIVELYWQRDEQAIKQTDIKYKKFLISIAYNIVHDTYDSEECLNDTYIGAWNAIPPARPALLQAFLATIMRRTAIDCYKARNRQKRITSELTVSLSEVEAFIADDGDMYSETDAEELGRVISDFVRSLSDRRMYIFMSRYYFARPIKEIAKLLDCSDSTVNKEIAAIKCALKEKLEKEGYSV